MGSPRLARRGISYKTEPDEGYETTITSVWFQDEEPSPVDEHDFYLAWHGREAYRMALFCELDPHRVAEEVNLFESHEDAERLWRAIDKMLLHNGFSTWHSSTRLLVWDPDGAPPEPEEPTRKT